MTVAIDMGNTAAGPAATLDLKANSEKRRRSKSQIKLRADL
jgi:hypothetical protein